MRDDGARTSVEPTEQRIYIENEILRTIESDPLSAAQLLYFHKESQALFVAGELEQLELQIMQEIIDLLHTALGQNDFQQAQALAVSLQTLSVDTARYPAGAEIALLENRAHLQEKRYLPLLHALHTQSNYHAYSDEEIAQFLEIAFDHNHVPLMRTLITVAEMRSISFPSAYSDFIDTKIALSTMLNGTVTVLVDRGYKIEDGVGVPDRSLGSGFFIDSRGFLLTNYHVIQSEVDPTYEGYSRLYIRISDDSGTKIPAQVVSYDRALDIALLKVEIEPQFIFALRPQTTAPENGTTIFALGSPLGLQNSITAGIVSATNRKFLQIGESLQIDVPVNPGNSGGPLIDTEGNVVGIVFAGIQQLQGINFAIPSRWIWESIPLLFNTDIVMHQWLGVALNMGADGLEVMYVIPNSPAHQVDINVGDVITHLVDTPIVDISHAQFIMRSYRSTSLIPIQLRRDDQQLQRIIKTAERPMSPIETALEIQDKETLFAPLFGMRVQQIGSRRSKKFVVEHVYRGTLADELGIAISDPFTLLGWEINEQFRVVIAQVYIKKRKNGFLDSGIQIMGQIDPPIFL